MIKHDLKGLNVNNFYDNDRHLYLTLMYKRILKLCMEKLPCKCTQPQPKNIHIICLVQNNFFRYFKRVRYVMIVRKSYIFIHKFTLSQIRSTVRPKKIA